jgi:hypothetical protein
MVEEIKRASNVMNPGLLKRIINSHGDYLVKGDRHAASGRL